MWYFHIYELFVIISFSASPFTLPLQFFFPQKAHILQLCHIIFFRSWFWNICVFELDLVHHIHLVPSIFLRMTWFHVCLGLHSVAIPHFALVAYICPCQPMRSVMGNHFFSSLSHLCPGHHIWGKHILGDHIFGHQTLLLLGLFGVF
jgi:hypothetical protein